MAVCVMRRKAVDNQPYPCKVDSRVAAAITVTLVCVVPQMRMQRNWTGSGGCYVCPRLRSTPFKGKLLAESSRRYDVAQQKSTPCFLLLPSNRFCFTFGDESMCVPETVCMLATVLIPGQVVQSITPCSLLLPDLAVVLQAVEDALNAGIDRFSFDDRDSVKRSKKELRVSDALAKEILDRVTRKAFLQFVARSRGQRDRLEAAKELKKMVFFSNIVVANLLDDVQVCCHLLTALLDSTEG